MSAGSTIAAEWIRDLKAYMEAENEERWRNRRREIGVGDPRDSAAENMPANEAALFSDDEDSPYRGGNYDLLKTLLTREAVRAALVGDWRLVFTDSPPALKGGVSGLGGLPFCSSVAVLQRLSEGNPAAQCIEVVGLPLGVRNAVILKGGWTVDADAMLLCEYSSSEVAGGTMPEVMR